MENFFGAPSTKTAGWFNEIFPAKDSIIEKEIQNNLIILKLKNSFNQKKIYKQDF